MNYEEQSALWDALSYFDDCVDPRSLPDRVEQLERDSVVDALTKHNGNRSRAASQLGIGRTNLIAKIKKYEITVLD